MTSPAMVASNRELAAAAVGAPLLLILVSAPLAALGATGAIGGTLAMAIAFVVPAVVVARRHGGVVAGLGLLHPGWRALLGAILAGASMWLVITVLLHPILEVLPDREATEHQLEALKDGELTLATRLVLFAVVPAVIEELLCRGLLCRHLGAQLGPAAGVGISALYFAALHLSLTQGLPALVTGVVCGVLVLRTGSTVAAIAYHLVNNLAVILVSAPELIVGDLIEAHAPIAIMAAAAVALVAVAVIRSVPRPGSHQ